MSQEEVQQVAKQVSNDLHEGRWGVNEIQPQVDSLASMSKLTNERIAISAQRTKEIAEQLYGFADKTKANFDSITRYTVLASRKLYLATDMNEHLQRLLQDLENLANGRLEPGVITPSQLNETIVKINRILKTTLPNFELVMLNPQYYYSKAKVAAVRINDSLVIEVQFPMSSWDHHFDTYLQNYHRKSTTSG